jgi:hypothetical protein
MLMIVLVIVYHRENLSTWSIRGKRRLDAVFMGYFSAAVSSEKDYDYEYDYYCKQW